MIKAAEDDDIAVKVSACCVVALCQTSVHVSLLMGRTAVLCTLIDKIIIKERILFRLLLLFCFRYV